MTAEQLNIKIKLDISEVKNGAKKVKQELSGMTDKVKQSLPKISTESKNAKDALSKVSDVSKDVKKNIADIGQEANSSLSAVTSQSRKITQSFADIKAKTGNIKFGVDGTSISDSTTEAGSAIDMLRDKMDMIVRMNFFDILSRNFDKITGKLKNFAEEIKIAYDWNIFGSFDTAKKSIKDLGQSIKSLFTAKLKDAKTNLKDFGAKAKEVFREVRGFARDSLEAIVKLVSDLGIKIGALLSVIGLLSAAKIGTNIANDTKQYREEQSKLISAFQAAGASATEASQAYNGLFRFLGESDQAVEAANHLAKLTTDTQKLAEWTTICQGIYATFGDSLNIEGLTEAANETARVGKVTSTLADALNWAGVNEDAFNAQLEKTTSLSEREALIRGTLNGLYNNAAQLYEQNNKPIIEQNEAQARLNATMARIGQQTQVLVTSFINLKNTIMTLLAPAIIYVSAVLSVLIDKLAAAIKWLGGLLGIDFKTDAISGAVSGVGTSISNATGATDALKNSLDSATGSAEKLKRTTMGFDELNIVNNPNTSSGGGASAGAGSGGIGDVAGIETGKGILGKFGEQIEDIKSKVEGFFDKWKTQIGIISGALAALGVAKLLEHLGQAIGLGDKFLTVMRTIKGLAATAIVITLQYTLMNEWLKSYIDGNGFKEYLKAALVGAIGTGILYSMWGPAGLVIGLGVSAVASLKAVIDNGGITNVQSAVVALTGLASAIGAVGIALSKLKIGTFFASLASGGGIVASLTAAFPKLTAAITPVVTAVSAFVGSLTTGAILTVAGVITGIASVVIFLKNNWDAVTESVKGFFKTNIVPKLNEIKICFEKLKVALSGLIPPALRQALKDIVSAIGDIIKKIGEWFNSTELIKAIGKAFEAVGGVIFGAVTGVIAGAISTFVGLIEGAVKVITGIVEIVSGVVNAVVALFSGDLQKAGDAVKRIADGIVSCFKGLYNMTIGIVVNFVKGVINWFTNLWDELVGHSIVPDMINAIVKWFLSLPSKIFGSLDEFVKGVINKFKNMWENIKTWFKTNVAPKFTREYWNTKFDTIRQSLNEKLDAAKTVMRNMWNSIKSWFASNVATKLTKEYWLKKFDTIKTGASQKLSEVKSTIQNTWSTIKSWFKSNVASKFTTKYWAGKFNSIKDGARSAFNGVISVVESAVNGIIRKLNTLHWSIPDWVPGVGGRSFGFSLSTISIPRLATGGIATRSTLANIGERGAEAVLPLTGAQGMAWMDKLADKIAERSNNNAPTKVVLNLDGRELGWATIDQINAITKQTGGLQLTL